MDKQRAEKQGGTYLCMKCGEPMVDSADKRFKQHCTKCDIHYIGIDTKGESVTYWYILEGEAA